MRKLLRRLTVACGLDGDVGGTSATRPVTPPERCDRRSLWRGAVWTLAIFVGLLSGGQSPAAESLTLSGASPHLDFLPPGKVWSIYAETSGFSILDQSSITVPFRIKPSQWLVFPSNNNGVVIEANGYIGFGTGFPQKQLHVSTSDFFPTLRLESTDATYPRTWDVSGSALGFSLTDVTNGGTIPFTVQSGAPSGTMFLDSNGNMSLGTGNPAMQKIHAAADDSPTIRLEQIAGQYPGHTWDIGTNESQFAIDDITFGTKPFRIKSNARTDTLVVSTNGNVGIGTATPDVNSRLEIRSSSLDGVNGLLLKRTDANSNYLRVENPAGAFRSGVQANGDVQFGSLTAGKKLTLLAGGTAKVLINGTGQMSFGNTPPAIAAHALVHQSGAHLTSGGVWTSVSSRAKKQDIEPITIEQARDAVRALQPVGYRYKNELDERYVGFIAEDVPELVATNDRKGLGPMDITAVLTKVVQDQDQQLDQHRQELGQQQQVIVMQQKLLETLNQRLATLEQQHQPLSVPGESQ